MAAMPPAPGWLGYFIDGGDDLRRLCLVFEPRPNDARQRLRDLGVPDADIALLSDEKSFARLIRKWRRRLRHKTHRE